MGRVTRNSRPELCNLPCSSSPNDPTQYADADGSVSSALTVARSVTAGPVREIGSQRAAGLRHALPDAVPPGLSSAAVGLDPVEHREDVSWMRRAFGRLRLEQVFGRRVAQLLEVRDRALPAATRRDAGGQRSQRDGCRLSVVNLFG